MYRFKVLILLFLFIKASVSSDCVQRNYGYSSFVCVCNSTFCNFDGVTTPFDSTEVKVIKTSIDQFRNYEEILPRLDGTVDSSQVDFSIFVNPNVRRQEVVGYGGAFTDSASMNIKSLSQEAQDNLMNMYFGDEGSRYNLARIPIAGSDFSTHPYSYDDIDGDVDLVYFNLTDEDYSYKIPLLRQAVSLASEDFYILASPWSPPSWMKTNGKFNESGELLREMWQPYANYLVKFFEMYEDNLGSTLWGFTPQNEPLGGFDPNWSFNTCGWSAEDSRDWIASFLGPTVSNAGYRRLQFLIDDFNRSTLPWYTLPTLSNSTSEQYVDGIAVHWYDDFTFGPEPLDETHEIAPDKFILYTEACVDRGTPDIDVALGTWDRGEMYVTDIIENSNHWVTGWIDWNLALDLQGGPNWVGNFVDAPVIVNATADEFYVQPMYYAVNLFSRNVQRGATAIYNVVSNDYNDFIRTTAFQNPNGEIVLIAANTAEKAFTIGVINENSEYIFKYTIEAKTWLAIIYKD
ncbi:putative glucosylceramidase 4 [Armadillidium nasatum]|uniref:Glucosylceramidase n=1 Tax=Armadillidium nasatum TaxID=96803 RepID=A0A5N5SV61_9CRUS|nr:putative glucosylceramidase 4 [Armadillidium nasatum]